MTVIITLARLFFSIFRSKRSLVCENAMLKKELQIVKRGITKKKISTTHKDRLFFTLLQAISNIMNYISIVKPETILKWQRLIIRNNWTFAANIKRRGRPPIARDVQNLILTIKNENILWGVRKIQGELRKLGIFIDHKTIWNILRNFRKKGKVRTYLNWKKFLTMQMSTIYAMDQQVPQKYEPKAKGKIIKMPVLSGWHHHYFRDAA